MKTTAVDEAKDSTTDHRYSHLKRDLKRKGEVRTTNNFQFSAGFSFRF